MHQPAAAPAARVLPYETETATAAGVVGVRAEPGAGLVGLKLSRFPFGALYITDDEASCLALHLAAAAERARAA